MNEIQMRKAIEMWNSGRRLGEIAAELDVGVYDVTWLTRASLKKTREAEKAGTLLPDGLPILLDADLILGDI